MLSYYLKTNILKSIYFFKRFYIFTYYTERDSKEGTKARGKGEGDSPLSMSPGIMS